MGGQFNGRHSDALVLFGITGDLAHRKIFPALHELVRKGRLNVPVIGVAKSSLTRDQLVERARDGIKRFGKLDEEAFLKLVSLFRYVSGDYREATTFDNLRRSLGEAKRPLHFLAIPPAMFAVVVQGLDQCGAAEDASIVVEKPFGRDLASSRELDAVLLSVFDEDRVFRIDHYLGKEAVQNVLYFRFANSFLEPLWNRGGIARVQITMAEKIGVEGRGRFYEEVGALRDVVQNHLMQVLAYVAMDPPPRHGPLETRQQVAQLLRAVRPLDPAHLVRGQYAGYRGEPGVAPQSPVETFAALELRIDSWRWDGVPFLIRTGKRMPVSATEVIVELRHPPAFPFGDAATGRPNYVRFRLGPEVVIGLGARAKKAGEHMVGEAVELCVRHQTPEEMDAYQRLLGDALHGDGTLFAGKDAIDASWRLLQPVLEVETPIFSYEQGTWGPAEAERLAGDAGWSNPAAAM